jgi:hypothetical protein
MKRKRIDLHSLDFSKPRPAHGYNIPPAELSRIDGEKIRCPKCGDEFVYQSRKIGQNPSNLPHPSPPPSSP